MRTTTLPLRRVAIALTLLAVAASAPTWRPVAARLLQEKHPAPPVRRDAARDEAIRLNNLGVAYMNQQRLEQALERFEQAAKLDPNLNAARLNRGIALMNLQRTEPARAALLEATEREPQNPRAWYNLGLLRRNTGESEAALEAFGRAAALAPDDPDVHYFVGMVELQLQHYDKAIAAFEQTLKLNPFHVSAEFSLARAWQRAGDTAKAREHLARFQKLTAEKLGAPMSLVYGEQGKYSLAEQVIPSTPVVPPAIPVRFVPVPAQQSGLNFKHQGNRVERYPDVVPIALAGGAGACLFDFDNDGRPDVFLVNTGEGAASALYRNVGGRFEDVTRAAGLDARGLGRGCAAGDFDNDGWTDLAVSFADGVRLYRNQHDGTFKDVTQAAGIRRDSSTFGVTFVDYDHDGDLDLYVTRMVPEGGGHNILWRNNGNSTFTEWTEPTGLAGNSRSVGAVFTDFNNDRAVDLLVFGSYPLEPATPLTIFFNPREGKFKPLQPWPKTMTNSIHSAAILDFDKDGWMDIVFAHQGPPGITLWRNRNGRELEPVSLPKLDLRGCWSVTPLDYDNDGWIDLAAACFSVKGKPRIVLLRNEGPAGFRDVTTEVGLDQVKLEDPRALLAADYDGDGGVDLLVTQNGGPPVLLHNEGGNKNNWMSLPLKGLADNKSAFGTKVEVFAGALYQKWEIPAAFGYLSQSALDLHIGLGDAKQADIVRFLWPTGVLQDEVELSAGSIHAITELDRRGSSCPLLFAWNGRRYEFIADMIGPGVVGHWVAPGERNIADPTEYLKVSGESLRESNGRLRLRFMEPMEETVYLDQARLLAVDHPADVEVYPNEYFASAPPFPEFRVIASHAAHPPLGAWDDRGRDVLPELLARDRRYVTSFAAAPYTGFAALHWVELDLGEWSPGRALRLLLDGFTDYFTATSMYAAYQAGVAPIAPYVEARNAQGRWVRVVDDMGFPAGLARTIVADLTGKLPAGTRRIRIVTNLKIYWDRILIDTPAEELPYRLSEAPLASATLGFHGYPREVRGNPPSDISYAYEEVSATGPYARATGRYTRFGDVRDLLLRADDRFVVFGSGEEVSLDFDSTHLPPLLRGWRRDFFFFADGFCKDMDFYAAHFDTVEPLPYHTLEPYPYRAGQGFPQDEEHLGYQLEMNTREVSGRTAPGFRFQYSPRPRH